jgi:hypothetical protein
MVIHQSVPILLLRGGIAWFLLIVSDYIYDLLPALSSFAESSGSFTNYLYSSQSLFHLIINLLFGWLILFVVLNWFYEYYIIQNDAIIVRHGIIFSKEDVYQMEDVKSIDVSQGFFGKLFNTGTVEFFAFRMNQAVYLNHIASPYKVATLIHSLHPTFYGSNMPYVEKSNREVKKKFNQPVIYKK